jgi:hypothetical protein
VIARTLTKLELADALDIDPRVIDQWAAKGTLPPTFYVRDGDRSNRYPPVALALGLLIAELARIFGSKSSVPHEVARQVAQQLPRLWADPDRPVELTIQKDEHLIVISPLRFVQEAKAKLEASLPTGSSAPDVRARLFDATLFDSSSPSVRFREDADRGIRHSGRR